MSKMNARKAKSAVVSVGDGRGFVVNGRKHLNGPPDRLVVTAAHCLPSLPPCHGASYSAERTYKALLAALGRKPAVFAECLFADPISDIAVLGSPGDLELSDQADAYEALMESVTPRPIADAPEQGQGWLLSLDGTWFRCSVAYNKRLDGPLVISNTEQPIVFGMSGSPVLSSDAWR